jgi:DNA-binding XRE family transcriptional regulator
MVNRNQIAAARVWLGISQAELALASGVAQRTIAHLEKGGPRTLHDRTLKDIVSAMENMGVEFLSEKNVGVGIRIENPKVPKVILDARAAQATEKNAKKDPTKKAPAKKAGNSKPKA